MKTSLRHQMIKQSISLVVIWLAFQVAAMSTMPSLPWLTALKPLISASLFILLYKAIDTIYDGWLWKLFNREYVLSGQWVYALHSLHSGRSVFGAFTIDQSVSYIDISNGLCWYAPGKGELRGSWQGQVVRWAGNTITILFQMRSLNVTQPGSPFGEVTEGAFIASYKRTPIVKLTGIFNDLGIRSESQGTFVMKRVKKPSQEEINKIGMELVQEIAPTQSKD